MKEQEPLEDKSVERYFSLWRGGKFPHSIFKGTIVEEAINILIKNGQLVQDSFFYPDGTKDTLVYFPDWEFRVSRANKI